MRIQRAGVYPISLGIVEPVERTLEDFSIHWGVLGLGEVKEIRDGLRLTFKELVDALVDRLTPKPDGTRKKLVGVNRLLEFLDTFTKKDVANDQQLLVLVEEVRGLLQGQDISRLRKDQGLRELVQERMQSVKVGLDYAGRGCTGTADRAGIEAPRGEQESTVFYPLPNHRDPFSTVPTFAKEGAILQL